LEEECSGNYKPQPGMLFEASKELNIDLEKSYIIGDRWRDIGAGYKAGTKTILIDYKYSEKLIYEPNYYAQNLSEAVDIIINNESV
jgi:D-glycero-D-manno-heptose 1,7-bisphosphate phosphatase